MRFLILTLSFFLFSITAQAEDSLSNSQQDAVKKLVRDALLENPEIIVEAMEILQKRQEMAREEQQKNALKTISFESPITPIAGNPNGDVTMIEFFDYQCGYCKRAFPGVMEVVNSDKNVRFVLKEFAILGPISEVAARAALAAEKQGKYLDFHSAMMSVKGRLDENKIYKTAASVGLNIETLKEDMKSDDVNAEITSTRQIAEQLGISGTPAFIIGDQIIPGAVPPEALKDAIKQQREM